MLRAMIRIFDFLLGNVDLRVLLDQWTPPTINFLYLVGFLTLFIACLRASLLISTNILSSNDEDWRWSTHYLMQILLYTEFVNFPVYSYCIGLIYRTSFSYLIQDYSFGSSSFYSPFFLSYYLSSLSSDSLSDSVIQFQSFSSSSSFFSIIVSQLQSPCGDSYCSDYFLHLQILPLYSPWPFSLNCAQSCFIFLIWEIFFLRWPIVGFLLCLQLRVVGFPWFCLLRISLQTSL